MALDHFVKNQYNLPVDEEPVRKMSLLIILLIMIIIIIRIVIRFRLFPLFFVSCIQKSIGLKLRNLTGLHPP